MAPLRKWFERAWEYREAELYPDLFGREWKGIYPLSAEIFAQTFKQSNIDPRWLHHGVFQFAPTARRRSWLYVTSGMSNDWESEIPNPKRPSGLGCEFILEAVSESQWAIVRLLHIMAFQILLAHGRYPGRERLSTYDRLPLKTSLVGTSQLTFLILTPPHQVPMTAQLESGRFDFFHIAAVTDSEAAYAREQGSEELFERLARAGCHPVINPDRSEIALS